LSYIILGLAWNCKTDLLRIKILQHALPIIYSCCQQINSIKALEETLNDVAWKMNQWTAFFLDLPTDNGKILHPLHWFSNVSNKKAEF